MLIRVSAALLAFIFVALAPVQGQDQPITAADTSTQIATDRPSFTNSSIVVPSDSLQAENGFLETYNQGQNVVDGPETLLRMGVATKTELRFTVPDYFYNASSGSGPGSGFGDLAIGVKQQLGPMLGGFDVSATLFVSIPTGAKTVSSGGYDPGLQVAWSHGLSAKWTAAGMLSMYWPTQGQSRNPTGQITTLVDRQLTGPWDAFIEYAGNFPERGGSRHFLHFGTSLKLAKTQQLDFQFGEGLTGTANRFVGIGYSFRIQALHCH
jgi:Putative MetA-pathway of phenol degradation